MKKQIFEILDFLFRKFKVHPKIMCRIFRHCCNYSDEFDCDYCKKMNKLDYWS